MHQSKTAEGQAVKDAYKVWSAFTKTLRAVAIKNYEEDLTVKTVYFGKFYFGKADISSGAPKRTVAFQPPAQLQISCDSVIQDKHTLSNGQTYYFPNTDSLVSREVKLNLLSISKVANQSIASVEHTLQGLLDALISKVALTEDGKKRIKVNLKIGQLYIQNKNLQFVPESFGEMLKKSVKFNNRRGKDKLSSSQSFVSEGIRPLENTATVAQDETKSILYDEKSKKKIINADTLNQILSDHKSQMSSQSKRSHNMKTSTTFDKQSAAVKSKATLFQSPLINDLNRDINKDLLERTTVASGASRSSNLGASSLKNTRRTQSV